MIQKIKSLLWGRTVCLPEYEVNDVMYVMSQSIGWGLEQNKIPEVWTKTKGKDVMIAVIDTGMPVHPDLNANVLQGQNFIPGEDIYDENGHQTHCVGIICAQNNDFGMVGVAPEARCLCIKGLANNGSGSTNGIVRALKYCLEVKPDIVSMSLGGSIANPDMHEVIKKLNAAGIVVVCAAGNSGAGGVNYPGAFPETIAVGSHDVNGKLSYFSSRGEEVDWAAPGDNIYSTYTKGRYANLSGTSMACPYVAGVIALMLSHWKAVNREYNVNDIWLALLGSTIDKYTPGKDNYFGNGIIDVRKLLNMTNKPKPEPEPKPIEPEPEPKPEPEPEPQPDPKPIEPEPKPIEPNPETVKTPWLKKNIAWIGVGVVMLIGLIILILNCISTDTRTSEHPVIDWDQKYMQDVNQYR